MTKTPEQIHRELTKQGYPTFESICLEAAIKSGDKARITYWKRVIYNTPHQMVLPQKYADKLKKELGV